MTDQPIRVLIVDDQFIVRSGLATFVATEPTLTLVGEAKDGQEAVRLCDSVAPDVVLMDLLMPRMDGVTATKAILQNHPDVKILALTSFMEKAMVQEILRAGAKGYLLKDVSAEELADAIRNVHAGRPALAPEAMEALLDQQRQSSEATLGHDLTEREHDVLALMVQGLSNPQIAEELIVSLSTVKFHVSSILGKLEATTRSEAVRLALQHHLVDESEL
ncbi:MAG: response regulator transcription factor [Caldilineaceae bacterium]|nr:response regulator transcription factor [Caldilineaceae bacterium]MCB0186654.1 response regulator transcription factor [Caldilineaceae bacterium]